MTKTRDQMIQRAATKLGHNPAGQTIATEDYERIDENLESILSDIPRATFYVGDFDTYDDESFEALADYLAGGLGDDFAKPEQWSMAKKADALRRLKTISAASGTSEPLKTDSMLRFGAHRNYGGTILDG